MSDHMEGNDPVEVEKVALMADGKTPRCQARSRQSGVQCGRAASPGTHVCASHGSKAPQVRRKAQLRLASLVDPAIGTLAREMVQADTSRDKQSAANSILDRAGFGRQTSIEATDAREILAQRLIALAAQPPADAEDMTEENATDE